MFKNSLDKFAERFKVVLQRSTSFKINRALAIDSA
jgi:hypothetical protein